MTILLFLLPLFLFITGQAAAATYYEYRFTSELLDVSFDWAEYFYEELEEYVSKHG